MTYRTEINKIIKTHPLAQASEQTAEQTKQCRKCGESKPLSVFYRKSSTPDGLNRLCKRCWKRPKLKPELATSYKPRRGLPILIPLAPVEIEEPQQWVSVERASMPIAEPERERVDPKIDIDAEKATREELAEFIKRFVVEYITKNGETVDEFFRHWISHKYPEIEQESITRAISGLLKEAKVKVTRWEVCGFERINFLALA